MNYIGNYASWITPELMNHLTTHEGDITPVWQPDKWSGHPLLEEYREKARPVYSLNTPLFQQFNIKSKDMQGFNIILPDFPDKREFNFWWFVKLLPGQMQAMHIDPHLVEVKNPVRYTMFLEDYHPGHIFVWDDKMSANYKAGDVFEWSDPMIVHGCVNISYKTRYTLQITMHDSN
jgi:hypothetical protein